MSLCLQATTSKGVKLLALGYKYNSSKVLCFLATKNSGSTTPGDPYRARFLDDDNNLINRPVDRPELISTYFLRSNGIDKHNQARYYELRLEKHWRTHNAWFRLATTMIGICVTDAWKAYRYAFQKPKNCEELPIKDFADRLAYELINNTFDNNNGNHVTQMVLSPFLSPRRCPRLLGLNQTRDDVALIKQNLEIHIAETTVSPLTSHQTKSTSSKQIQTDVVWMQLLELHKHVQQDGTEATGRKIRHRCEFCQSKTGWYCKPCNVYCCPELKLTKKPRHCYKEHVLDKHPSLKLN